MARLAFASAATLLARLASPLTLLALLTFVLALPAQTARSQTAEQIIAKAEDLVKGTSCKGSFTMTVVSPSYTRTVKMDSWWVGNEKALIVVRYPKKEEGNKTLKIGNELWTYLKNTETTIKLPPSMMLQSWNGSDFTNDDLVRESNLSKDYRQTVLRHDTIHGERCWVIELVPRPDAPVVWGKILYAVRQSDNLPAWQDYYDERGALMRRMEYGDYRIMGGRKIPATWAMLNTTKDGHRTALQINSIQFDIPISDRMFSYRELEKRD